MPKRKTAPAPPRSAAFRPDNGASLLRDVTELIRQARAAAALAGNAALVQLYWRVGQRIRTEVLKEQRAGCGEEIGSILSSQLTAEFGNGFPRQNRNRMIRFAEVFPEAAVVAGLSRARGRRGATAAGS